MLTIAPEILIEHGDPSRLPVETRAQLLRQFASLNEGHSDTGASFDIDIGPSLGRPKVSGNRARLAQPTPENEDVRQLLLRIVWQGQISECAESALSFALDTQLDPYTRICGIWAVGAAGNKDQKRRLADGCADQYL